MYYNEGSSFSLFGVHGTFQYYEVRINDMICVYIKNTTIHEMLSSLYNIYTLYDNGDDVSDNDRTCEYMRP